MTAEPIATVVEEGRLYLDTEVTRSIIKASGYFNILRDAGMIGARIEVQLVDQLHLPSVTRSPL